MNRINKQLKKYIEEQILPIYRKNEAGHGIEHINYVIKRSIVFADQFPNIDIDMVYTIAAFHDIAHHIDKNNHEILSAQIFYEDEKMKEFFNDEKRRIIKEAIEDHRASLEYEPRSDYGKIVSSADRKISVETCLKTTYSYTTRHNPSLKISQIIDHSYNHAVEKYGPNGYSKTYCYDVEYEKFKNDIIKLINNREEFIKKYKNVNNL